MDILMKEDNLQSKDSKVICYEQKSQKMLYS